MKVAVTGAGGFLGGSIVRDLVNRGHQVHACVHSSADNLLSVQDQVDIFRGDIRDRDYLCRALDDCQMVYHFASATNPSVSFGKPEMEIDNTISPLLGLVKTAAKCGVRKIVYASSGGTVYGGNVDGPCDEETATRPESPYAVAKVICETWLNYFVRRQLISCDIYRIANPYGPGQVARAGQGVILHWLQAIADKKDVLIFGGHENKRDYIYIDDLVELMSVSLHSLEGSDLFNLCSGRSVSILELFDALQHAYGQDIPNAIKPARESDAGVIELSPKKLLEHFPGFEFRSLTSGLAATIHWFQSKAVGSSQ